MQDNERKNRTPRSTRPDRRHRRSVGRRVRERLTDEPHGDGRGHDDGNDAQPAAEQPRTGAACAVTPNETVGPYPSLIDLFRSDIRESKSGTRLDLAITVVNTATSCAPLTGVNVEIWQCDASGNYSQYGSERAQTYLRGIQTTDANGQVTFTTVYPGGIRDARRTFTSKSRATASR